MSELTDRIKDKKVSFVRYCSGQFHYKCEDGFEFSVPLEELGPATTLLANDKAILFTTWIKRQMEFDVIVRKK